MGRKEFKPGALTAPLPAVLVTVGTEDEYNVITIGWTGILSTHPPRTYVSIRPSRYSYGLVKRSGEFVINLTTADMVRAVDYAGVFTGKKVDKMKECGFSALKSNKVAPPTIAESPLALECRVVEVIPMGTHDVFVADIVGITADESILDKDGRLCFDKAGLLAYAHGEYFAIGEKLGAFGFSAKKEAKRSSPKAPRMRAAQTPEKEAARGKGAQYTSEGAADEGDKPRQGGAKKKRGAEGYKRKAAPKKATATQKDKGHPASHKKRQRKGDDRK